jgi:ABC-type Na+ efflux pump permease subunit
VSTPTAAEPVSTRRPVKIWDLVLTIVLVLPLPVLGVLTAIMAGLLVMVSDPCTAQTCDYARIDAGVIVAFIAPIVVIVLGVAASIIVLVLRRLAFWIPLTTALLAVAAWFVGFLLAGSGVPDFF